VTADEKVALVTGATRGIGRAVSERLLREGRRVIACARDARALAELARLHPGRVHPVSLDLGERGAAERLFSAALSLATRIDELVWAAGIVHYTPLEAVSEAELRAQLELNFVSAYLLGQRLGARMREQGGGSMVFVASTLAERAAPLTSAYAASKAALVSAARSMALELAPEVRSNVVAPGVVDTDMIRVARGGQASAEARDELRKLHPLGRLGTPGEVADAVWYLLTADWATGSVLTLDGGLTAG
jgi:3-oxoacyl-[acyl-carrier protein] reductase